MPNTEYSLSYNTYARRRTIRNVSEERLRTSTLCAALARAVERGAFSDVKVTDAKGADVTGEFFQ